MQAEGKDNNPIGVLWLFMRSSDEELDMSEAPIAVEVLEIQGRDEFGLPNLLDVRLLDYHYKRTGITLSVPAESVTDFGGNAVDFDRAFALLAHDNIVPFPTEVWVNA